MIKETCGSEQCLKSRPRGSVWLGKSIFHTLYLFNNNTDVIITGVVACHSLLKILWIKMLVFHHVQKQPSEVQTEASDFIKKETLPQIFSCEFCEISKKFISFFKNNTSERLLFQLGPRRWKKKTFQSKQFNSFEPCTGHIFW